MYHNSMDYEINWERFASMIQLFANDVIFHAKRSELHNVIGTWLSSSLD